MAFPTRISSFLLFVHAAAGILCAQPHQAERFLEKYCLECHDSAVQKGERTFEELFFPLEQPGEVIETQEIIDQLNLGAMPPKKADQPSSSERAEAIALMTEEVRAAILRLKPNRNQTALRRLNEREYLNTLEQLFQRRIDTLAPTAKFPTDQTEDHLDTIGDALVTSSFLLNNYFDAAHLVVENALKPVQRPEVKNWHFKDQFYQGQELSYSHKKIHNYKYLCLYEVPNTVNHEGGYGGLERFKEGVHAAGTYEVKVLAHSVNRDSHYRPEIFNMDLAEPFRLGVVTGNARSGALHHPQPVEPKLDEVTVADGPPQWYTLNVWLEKGQQPRFIFPNGMANCRNAFSRIAREYKKEWPKDDKFHTRPGIVEARRVVLEHGKMPHIRIHEVKIRGPVYAAWPPAAQRNILGEGKYTKQERRRILENFADQAYRRPPSRVEVDNLVAVADSRIAMGHEPRQATIDAIKAALCSPSFIYLSEPGEDRDGKLSAHDLAARLSYFLTGTMPDRELRKLADSGKIVQTDILKKQALRLLSSSGSENFYRGFLDSWLNLRALGGMPPERSQSAPYFYDDLETAMKLEVFHFTRHLVNTNSPVTDFISSDYSFLNYPLAELYRAPFPYPVQERYQFKKIRFENSRRGGLLGMGAILTVSANGIETSPVTRGVFLLENIFGTPPPPPPDEVPAIEPDTRGTKTIRDQLEKHRELATCAECHQKIDPLGFALENFDPIGRWRNRYPAPRKNKQGVLIDASGELVDGTRFSNFEEFREQLYKRKDFFVRNLTEKLLAYGTGRPIGPLDRQQITTMIEATTDSDHGMRDIIIEVVASDLFRSR